MKRREVIRLMENAYKTAPTSSGRSFVRRYQTRKISWPRLILLQMKYMRAQTFATGMLLMLALIVMGRDGDRPGICVLSAFMPILSLMMLTSLSRSERHGMSELETVARFSLKLIRIVRLTLTGAAGVILIAVAAIAMRIITGVWTMRLVPVVAAPYLLTSSLSMMLIRKWHAKENIYGCIAIAGLVCAGWMALMLMPAPSMRCVRALLYVSVALTARETFIFTHEDTKRRSSACADID